MTKPDFTPKEQYLLSVYRLPLGRWLLFRDGRMWGYVLFGALMCGFGAVFQSIVMMVIGFIVVCGFRIYDEWESSRWSPVLRSIIIKYDAAVGVEDTRDRSPESGEPLDS